MNDLPFYKFFPADWLSDEKLRLCSRAARGTWQDMLCLMWKAARRGFLEIGTGCALSDEQLARVVGCSVRDVRKDVAELEASGVFSREEGTGVIYSRRLVRDAAFRQACSEAGLRGGGNPSLKGSQREPLGEPIKVQANHDPKPQKVRRSEDQKIRIQYNRSSSAELTERPPEAPVLTLAPEPPSAEAIYAAYPRKQGKQDALRAIAKAIAANPHARPGCGWTGFASFAQYLLDRTTAFAAATTQWSDHDRNFIPHPATWFNRGSYDDDPKTWERNYSTGNQHQQKAATAEEHAIDGGGWGNPDQK